MPHNNTIFTNWFAIDGAPCSGKTTLVEALSQKMGWKYCPDYAREVFSREVKKGKTIQSIQTLEKQQHYQDEIAFSRLAFMAQSNPNEIILHDYGLPSDIAWHEEKNVDVPFELAQGCAQYRYRRVFILDMVNNKNDEIRKETNTDRIRIHRRLWDTYQSLGYTPIRVPSFRASSEQAALNQRMEFIYGEIQSLTRVPLSQRKVLLETA